MKLTIITESFMTGSGWEEKEGEKISRGKVRRSLNEINKMRLCQLFSNNAGRRRQRRANIIFPRFHQSKTRNDLGSG